MKIGFGYDVHKLVKGRKLILGGVEIPFSKGLQGYSDADVLLHAIIDALLGALGDGDIGCHFPAGDPQYKGISSLKLLEKIKLLLDTKDYTIGNIDTTVVCEAPRIATCVEDIKLSIARALDISVSQVNVKGKTEEGLGFTGEGKGISAYAVCLLHKRP
jgi:2-C-methyl-D-erythritol 2,4-cyclodiphosphate synthase